MKANETYRVAFQYIMKLRGDALEDQKKKIRKGGDIEGGIAISQGVD